MNDNEFPSSTELAKEHRRLAAHPNQMKQTIPEFHTLTADRIDALTEQLATAQAVITEVRALADKAEHGALRWADPLPVPEWVGRVRGILSQSPTDALQAHDRQVTVKALAEIREAWLNPGVMPAVHYEAQKRLAGQWPTLSKAIIRAVTGLDTEKENGR